MLNVVFVISKITTKQVARRWFLCFVHFDNFKYNSYSLCIIVMDTNILCWKISKISIENNHSIL